MAISSFVERQKSKLAVIGLAAVVLATQVALSLSGALSGGDFVTQADTDKGVVVFDRILNFLYGIATSTLGIAVILFGLGMIVIKMVRSHFKKKEGSVV